MISTYKADTNQLLDDGVISLNYCDEEQTDFLTLFNLLQSPWVFRNKYENRQSRAMYEPPPAAIGLLGENAGTDGSDNFDEM